jgi:uncharacterized damage-inducible protein DinB
MTKKIAIISRTTYKGDSPGRMEKLSDEKITEPNQAMTLQQIVKKMASGLVSYERPVAYIDSELELIDKFHGQPLDLTDLDELQARTAALNARIEQAREEMEDEESDDNTRQSDEGAKKETKEEPESDKD